MAKQLVVSGNRIIAYGEDCFISMGGTVICTETERVFQNATVVNCDCIPCDLDEVGYEYHAGEFVPCGIPPLKDCAIEVVEYVGADVVATEENPMRIPLTIDPVIVFIGHRTIEHTPAVQHFRMMTEQTGLYLRGGDVTRTSPFSKDGNYVTWYNKDSNISEEESMNAVHKSSGVTDEYIKYVLIAIGKGRCN